MAVQKTLDGYPQPMGYSKVSVFPHLGPASYVVVAPVAGTIPMPGGDTVSAGEAGLKQFDLVDGGISDDGCWRVDPIPPTISNPSSGVTSGIPSTTYKLKWTCLVTATIGGQNQTAGNEAVAATVLSNVCVRLNAFGPK